MSLALSKLDASEKYSRRMLPGSGHMGHSLSAEGAHPLDQGFLNPNPNPE